MGLTGCFFRLIVQASGSTMQPSPRPQEGEMKRLLWAILVWPILLAAQEQKVLTNADILDMVNARLSDTVILDEIHKSNCKFSTEPKDLIALKKAGASDKVLEAMTSGGNPPAPV